MPLPDEPSEAQSCPEIARKLLLVRSMRQHHYIVLGQIVDMKAGTGWGTTARRGRGRPCKWALTWRSTPVWRSLQTAGSQQRLPRGLVLVAASLILDFRFQT